MICPCDSGLAYDRCCGPYHAGRPAPDAARLMRSRYSAFVLGDAAYLRASWHPASCPAELDLDQAPRPQWLGLKLIAHTTLDAEHATVEFVARYKLGSRAHRLHEISRFERVCGRWLYCDGELRE